LIPTYNRQKYLQEALLSIIYLGKDLEVIVGINGDLEPAKVAIESVKLSVPIIHFQNPPGSTGPDNLKALISRASGKWLTVLHDDDFFSPEAALIPAILDGSETDDFIFSDHWIVNSEGSILDSQSFKNSEAYGRSRLSRGHVENLQLLAVRQSICLDGYFVKTRLAQKCEIDTRMRYVDTLLMAQIARLAYSSVYLSERLFCYRVHGQSDTSGGIQQVDMLKALLCSCRHVDNKFAKAALKQRIRRQAWNALKFCIKRRKGFSSFLVFKALFGFY
jgi:glycosyltransferase involved in cell wall biosynthesis